MNLDGAMVAQARALGCRMERLACASDASPPGVYVSLTSSGAIYVIDLSDLDAPPTIVRHRSRGELLHDATPLPGVHGFRFDARTGRGGIVWWKDDPAHYDDPTLPYAGTLRSTSQVLLVARIVDPAATPPEHLIGHCRELMRGVDSAGVNPAVLLAELLTTGAEETPESS